MTKLTVQHIFNLGWKHFVVDGHLPSGIFNRCRYLNDDGNRCIVGLALAEHFDDEKIKEIDKDNLTASQAFEMLGLTCDNPSLMNEMQYNLHDANITLNDNWICDPESLYRDFAADHGLTIPE